MKPTVRWTAGISAAGVPYGFFTGIVTMLLKPQQDPRNTSVQVAYIGSVGFSAEAPWNPLVGG
jgi:hypothetical protein